MIEKDEMEIEAMTGKTTVKVIFDYEYTGVIIHENMYTSDSCFLYKKVDSIYRTHFSELLKQIVEVLNKHDLNNVYSVNVAYTGTDNVGCVCYTREKKYISSIVEELLNRVINHEEYEDMIRNVRQPIFTAHCCEKDSKPVKFVIDENFDCPYLSCLYFTSWKAFMEKGE